MTIIIMNIITPFFVSMLISFATCHPPTDILDREQTLEIVGQLNTLLSQPGWRDIDISVKKKTTGSAKGKQIKLKDNENADDDTFAFVPASQLLEVNLPGHAVTVSNMPDKYRDIYNVLQCKYAEVITAYRVLIWNLVDICRKKLYTRGKDFYEHFDVMLNKLESISVTVRYMRDALKCYRNIRPILCGQYGITDQLSTLEAFTRDIYMKTKSKLIQYRNEEEKYNAAKDEFKRITYGFNDKTRKPWYFLSNYCWAPHQVFTYDSLADDYLNKKIKNALSPSEATLFDYMGHKVDSYSGHIIKKWFYRLGFVYDATENPEKVILNNDILS